MSAERLFDFRTMDGEINNGAIATIREVEKRLSCFPQFVGIAIRGSTTRGYGTETSDLDLTLLYDSNVHSSAVDSEGHSFHLMRMLSKGTSLSTNSRTVESKWEDINPKRVCSEVPKWPGDIFRVVTGSKIAQYRKFYSELIRCLPKRQMDQIILELARQLTVDDCLGWRKMAERISGVPMSDYKGEINLYHEVLKANGVANRDVYESQRRELWKARVKRLLLISPSQLEEVA